MGKEYEIDWSNVRTFHDLRALMKALHKSVEINDKETYQTLKEKKIIKIKDERKSERNYSEDN